MKSFKQFMNGPSILSYDGSFASNRDNTPIKEDVDKEYQWTGHSVRGTTYNPKGVPYDGTYHHHIAIEPQGLTNHEKELIHGYTSIPSKDKRGHQSSSNINNYCRNCNGDKDVGVLHHDPDDVDENVSNFLKAFRPQTTNRTTRFLFSGIPEHIGHRLMNAGAGSDHILPGFTSATHDESVASQFAGTYGEKEKVPPPLHIMRIEAKPGSAISAAYLSDHEEDESIIAAGMPILYHGTTEHEDSFSGKKVFIHHVTTNPSKRVPLEQWGYYDHPEKS